VPRTVSSGNTLQVLPRRRCHLSVIEQVPFVADELVAVKVSCVQRPAAVDHHALQVICTVGIGCGRVVLVDKLVEAYYRVQKYALQFLVDLACSSVICPLGQAECYAGGYRKPALI
jgi:hypothetical protein